MAHPRISSKLPPDIDPTKAPIAFGRRALPKLNEELQDPDLLTRQRALMSLCDLVHDPENAYQAISIGFLDNLKKLLLDEDQTVRQKTTEVLYIMASHNVGRYNFIKHRVIPALAQLLNDPVDICRWNMHYGLKLMSEFSAACVVAPFQVSSHILNHLTPGLNTAKFAAGQTPRKCFTMSHDHTEAPHPLSRAIEIVESSLIPSLVLKLKTENEEIQKLLLETLSGCLRVEAFEALATGAVGILKEMLNHSSVEIRSRAAEALMAISVPLEGKNMLFQEEVFPDLVYLLNDDDAEVRANAAGALMSAAVTTQGKYAAINAAAIETLLPLIHDEKSKVRLYSIKALTMLAEAPEGRKILLCHVEEFEERMKDPSEAVKRAAKIAVEVITWKP